MPPFSSRLPGRGGSGKDVQPLCPRALPLAPAPLHVLQEATLISAAFWEGPALAHPEPSPSPGRPGLPLHPPGENVPGARLAPC